MPISVRTSRRRSPAPTSCTPAHRRSPPPDVAGACGMKQVTPSHGLQTLKAEFFRALAHPVRIRLLELLAAGEQNVQALQRQLDADQPIVSQQLAKLRASGIVVARKEGTTVSYRLADPMLADLLKVAKEILDRHLVGAQALLRELRREPATRVRR